VTQIETRMLTVTTACVLWSAVVIVVPERCKPCELDLRPNNDIAREFDMICVIQAMAYPSRTAYLTTATPFYPTTTVLLNASAARYFLSLSLSLCLLFT